MDTSRTSLYVGDLLPEVLESTLYNKFVPIGAIKSVRVCRDMVSKKSLGYAYVNFEHAKDAAEALRAMNFSMILGRPMRIMWSQRDPALRKSGKGNIFIKNLDPSIDSKSLHDTFNEFGPILSSKIVSDEHGSKGYGFVQFESEKCALDAIENVNGMLFNGKKLYVAKFVPKKERLDDNYNFNNVFVKNFGHDIDDDGLRSLFAKFGKITSYKIMRDDAGQSKGFGFVCFESVEDAKKAVNELDGFELNGKPLFVGRAQNSEERQRMLKDKFEQQKTGKTSQFQGINLYIKNIDDDVTEDRLRTEFSVFGTLTSVRIVTQNGESKGFGFVCFSDSEEAAKAIEGMNGRIISDKPLDVSLALSKEERRKLAMQHQNSMTPDINGNYFQNNLRYNRVPLVSVQQQRIFRNTRPITNQSANPRMPFHPSANSQHPTAPRNHYDSGNHTPLNMADQIGIEASPPHLQYMHNIQHAPMMPHYNNQMSYKPMPLLPMPVLPMAHSQIRPISNSELHDKTLENLSSASAPEQDMLGEWLYAEVIKENNKLTGKITGMLLELDTSEILNLLKSPMALREKVREAETVLQQTPRGTKVAK